MTTERGPDRIALTFRQLDSGDHRGGFDCGHDSINRWFHEQAGQSARKGTAATTVGIDLASGTIASFYALAAHRLDLEDGSSSDRRRPRRYPMSAILIAQLGVDVAYQGMGAGRATLLAALESLSSLSVSVGFEAVIVDAVDTRATAFYLRHTFVPLSDDGRRLMLPVRELRAMFPAPTSPLRD